MTALMHCIDNWDHVQCSEGNLAMLIEKDPSPEHLNMKVRTCPNTLHVRVGGGRVLKVAAGQRYTKCVLGRANE
jgi:hypothetical protein